MKKWLFAFCFVLMGCRFESNQPNFVDISSIDVIQNGSLIKTINIKNSDELTQVLNDVELVENDGSVPSQWDYKLRINTSKTPAQSPVLWLYSSRTGRLTLLTTMKTPLYQVKEVDALNTRLGITNNKP